MRSSISVCIALFIGAVFMSCGDSNTVTPPATSVDTFHSQKNFATTYDRYEVDTSKADGTNPDQRLDGTKMTVTETTIATDATYKLKTNVTVVASSYGSTKDTLYYWQDPSNGDLYRYNYGVSYINSFSFLVSAIGKPVDIGWVRVVKSGSAVGESWIAAKDSFDVLALGTKIYITNTATMKADTSIMVGAESVTCKHIQIAGAAKMTYNPGISIVITGQNVADTYISNKYGTTIWDYFRSSTTSTTPNIPQYNFKARGYSKVMASHK